MKNMPPAPDRIRFVAFVIRDFQTEQIFEDEIVQTGEDRYKSFTFRHTYYKASELFATEADAYKWIAEKKETTISL